MKKKKTLSWPKPADFDLDDDIGLLIGNRIHRVVGGQVIGQQNVTGNVVNSFGAAPRRRLARTKRSANARRPAKKQSARLAAK